MVCSARDSVPTSVDSLARHRTALPDLDSLRDLALTADGSAWVRVCVDLHDSRTRQIFDRLGVASRNICLREPAAAHGSPALSVARLLPAPEHTVHAASVLFLAHAAAPQLLFQSTNGSGLAADLPK
jgi:hypothetical protein